MKAACCLLLACCFGGPSVAKPAIVTKAEWGSHAAPIPEARRHTPSWVTIHHAGTFFKAGSDPADFVRRMQAWGQKRPQLEQPPRNTYWPDLPYHFMIAPDGRIFEGRDVAYEPETNTRYPVAGNLGVELMGDFEQQRPSPAQLRSCVALTAWLCQTHRIDLDHVRGHGDVAQGQTNCPGADFKRYLLDGQLRGWVQETLAGRVPAIAPGPPLPDGPVKLIGEP